MDRSDFLVGGRKVWVVWIVRIPVFPLVVDDDDDVW